MRFFTKNLTAGLLLLAFCLSATAKSSAITVAQLKSIRNLTPEKFAMYFSDFEFKFHAEIQKHDTFLSSKSGDCDDYATLAAEVLAKNGYTTRLIAIRMKGETHVVCYVNETKSYLDYNYRKENEKTIPCSDSITDIATKVAKSFDRDWVATYQFTYNPNEGVKRLVQNIITRDQAKSSG